MIYRIFKELFDEIYGNDEFFNVIKVYQQPVKVNKTPTWNQIKKETPIKKEVQPSEVKYYKWFELEKTWYLNIPYTDVEISVGEDNIEIVRNYEKGNLRSNSKRTISFPQNSLPETIKAKKVGDGVLIIINKEKIEDKPKRKILTIE